MKKIFHFEAPRGRYTCDAAIVWCFDNRFELGFRKFLKRIGVVFSDPIKIAGGARCLAAPEQVSQREFVLDQLRTSMRLHGTRRVILMLHSDCGAYGGLEAFGDDPECERKRLRDDLELAAVNVAAAIPEMAVETYYVDFEGVWTLKEAAAQAAG
ncbi:MAG: hypothetical protein JST11_19275 [Acidobacteria bacterium]|nr:hypothetical protein [Acidobacteriota bacterium]